ncbi:MAG: ABC transporter permease [Candidatus Parcubacteria bacterium]|nr:ABC transporter permease [Candidatus Parcubacteria bacterium]
MKTSDLISETYSALITNKARSGLTILGIVIGIGSVIAMIAIGQGSQQSIQSNIQNLGSNLIMVQPGFQRGAGTQVSQGRGSAQTLTLEDADAIGTETTAQAVAPVVSGRYQVTAKGTNTNTSVSGVTADYPAVRNIEIESGVFITAQNLTSMARVAVLGPSVRDDLFGEDADPVGQTIRINKIEFKIVGVTVSKGGTGFSNQDDIIFVPMTTAQQFLAGNQRVNSINVQAYDEKSMSNLEQEITDLLMSRHNITDSDSADFSIMNQSDIVETASSVTNTFTMLLASVAAISLVVGGIGIMNMMLTNVTERTREIGLRKAIGAKKIEISRQFLAEAITLTFFGGIIGIIVGWLISIGMRIFGGIATSISLSSILLAFGVSAAIGIIFGYYPARRAANLNPIEALRYE